ncbi:MAG: hypothetical protein HY317_00705 [Acidobacteria bacterium]|nr:hypothetical protein [Acidobacteriota bacterium]
MLLRPVLAAVLLAAAVPSQASQPQFWRIEGAREFLEGDTEGLSVDSEGRVRLAPAMRLLHDVESPQVWCVVRDGKGAVYAGTGNEGRVFRIADGEATVFYDATELEVHALAVGRDGRVYVGTAPDGRVYVVDEEGKAETFYDPADKYVWALAFDGEDRLLVATGLEGKVHRVDAKGKGEILLASSEAHVVSLAVDGKGNVYAGSSPDGIVYRIDAAGKVFVLHDAPFREVKALAVGREGSLFAALVDGKEKQEPSRAPAPMVPVPPIAMGGEVTVTEAFVVSPPGGPVPAPAPRVAEAPRPGAMKGAVIRILPTGEIDTLWSSAEDMPHSLAAAEDGAYVGTGDKGKLYRLRNDRTWTMVASFPAEQVTALQAGEDLALATSNPGKLHLLGSGAGERGTFVSKVKDTETVSTWGRLRWEAAVSEGTEVQVQTRSGNTGTPDSTWSGWSAAYAQKDGDPVTSERARFLQLRATLVGKAGTSPVLDAAAVAYLQRNLRPQVTTVTVHPPGEVFQKPLSLTGEIEILGLEPGESPEPRPGAAAQRPPGLPPATAYSRRLYQKGIQTFSWKAEDPNADTLVYDVSYRTVQDPRFRPLRKGLADAVLAWDTSTVPNGRYVVKVTARDSPGNPESLALAGEKESLPFDVDNTPPTVTALLAAKKPARVRAVARDDSSTIRRVEFSVDGGRWQEVHPLDGINDALEETYEIVPGDGTGPRILVVRATDQLGNVSTARVELP